MLKIDLVNIKILIPLNVIDPLPQLASNTK